jgi:hypothetical protein
LILKSHTDSSVLESIQGSGVIFDAGYWFRLGSEANDTESTFRTILLWINYHERANHWRIPTEDKLLLSYEESKVINMLRLCAARGHHGAARLMRLEMIHNFYIDQRITGAYEAIENAMKKGEMPDLVSAFYFRSVAPGNISLEPCEESIKFLASLMPEEIEFFTSFQPINASVKEVLKNCLPQPIYEEIIPQYFSLEVSSTSPKKRELKESPRNVKKRRVGEE